MTDKIQATAEAVSGTPINTPRFGVNGFQILASTTEVSILCMSQVVGLSESGAFQIAGVPALQLGMSPASAKELCVVLRDVVDRLEADFGQINTSFLTERTAKN